MTVVAYTVSGTGLDVDVEAAMVSVYRQDLAAAFTGLVVASTVPRTADGGLAFPPLLLVVSRSGGVPLSVQHDRPMLITQCWADTQVLAWELTAAARLVARGLSNRLVVLPPVRAGGTTERVWVSHHRQVGGPSAFDDPRTRHPRYQFTDMFTVRR